MPRHARRTGATAGPPLSLVVGAAALLAAACLVFQPNLAVSAEAGSQSAADESESDTDADKPGSDPGSGKEEDEDKPDESRDEKRKSYQGSTEPSY